MPRMRGSSVAPSAIGPTCTVRPSALTAARRVLSRETAGDRTRGRAAPPSPSTGVKVPSR